MKRLGILLIMGLMALSLTYLFKPRPSRNTQSRAIEPTPPSAEQKSFQKECLNINTATAEELEKLPGIGKVIAERILAYRHKHGPYARPEDIIIIDGIGEKKYRAIAEFICVE
jgi:competence protein ComEA